MAYFIKKTYLIFWLFCLPLVGIASPQPLPADQAFLLSLSAVNSQSITLRWDIAPEYYLYRDKFHFSVVSVTEPQQLVLGNVNWPQGTMKQDDVFGRYEVYARAVTLQIPIVKKQTDQAQLKVTYQGCAEFGFCYPPTTKIINVNFVNPSASSITDTNHVDASVVVGDTSANKLQQWLLQKNWLWMILGFFGIGILLAFTPCEWPMLPILAGIILGQGKVSTRQALSLALTYVLAMALTFSVGGLLAGLAGSYVQAFLQNPWVLGALSLSFVLLALSLFGAYELRLPQRWHLHLTHMSNSQGSGNYLGVAAMGCLATLIVSPCATAPLIGVLSYIANTGNALFGGIALFVMGLGMGVPLVVVATLGIRLLPKAGKFLHIVKILFGILLLVVATQLLLRIEPISSFFNQQAVLSRQFITVKTNQDVDRELAQARALGKPVLLDFYADWCIACKQMDRGVFADSQVQKALQGYVLLRVDVTANSAEDQAIEQRFKVIVPPAVLFFNASGNEVAEHRIVGEVGSDEFLRRLP